MEQLIKGLPDKIKKEILDLWLDYENGSSAEGRFFKHADRIESFLQAEEYWQKNKSLPLGPYWVQAHELHDDPTLLKFIDQIDEEFHKKGKK